MGGLTAPSPILRRGTPSMVLFPASPPPPASPLVADTLLDLSLTETLLSTKAPVDTLDTAPKDSLGTMANEFAGRAEVGLVPSLNTVTITEPLSWAGDPNLDLVGGTSIVALVNTDVDPGELG